MKIEILGTGCAKCDKLEALTREAVTELGIEAEIIKVKELSKIINYGVMLTPALVIDGVVKTAGKVPGKAEIINWLKAQSTK